MSWKKTVLLWVIAIGIGVAGSWPSDTLATHRWGCWKYANYYIYWYNGGTGDYWNIFNEEGKTDSDSWSPYTDVTLANSSSGTTDHINVYNGFYGSNGWLGIAEIRGYSGCTVKNGRVRLNQSYLDYGYTRTNKEHVACQEIGHLLGLNHNHNSNVTCMNDYILTAPQPDTHDRDMVNSIY